jgi:hypothetical protein
MMRRYCVLAFFAASIISFIQVTDTLPHFLIGCKLATIKYSLLAIPALVGKLA